jgi:hypothetical protein
MKFFGTSKDVQALIRSGMIVIDNLKERIIKVDDFAFVCEKSKGSKKSRYAVKTLLEYAWVEERVKAQGSSF